MHCGQIVFSQIMDFLPIYEFSKCVDRYGGNHRVRSFSCFDQFLCMAFAQLTGRESLRDIVTCLRALQSKLYHAGFRGHISRSTLSDANESRDWRIYADFAHVLIQEARVLYAQDPFGAELQHAAYVLDSTVVDLSLGLFPWAHFRTHKAAIKMHTLMDLHGSIPCFICITHAKIHDVTALDHIPIEPGAFYIMDKAYTDFRRLHRFTEHAAFFVIRAKANLDYARRSYRHVDKTTGLRTDQTIVLRGVKTAQFYPEPLRRITYYDAQTNRKFGFVTNNFLLPALTTPQLYKSRWDIELFFKWIKQHLRIKAFYGFSENAVKTQIWIAVSVYVLVAIIKKRLKLQRSLAEILQILSISIFEKSPILQALNDVSLQSQNDDICNQLQLFNF